jgi:putative oxygen-independent coproporphyrinogen III oxidase
VNPPPLSLYIHLPWCVRKCPYCDFNSHRAGDAPPKQRYVEALQKDLEHEAIHADGRAIESVFLGGGTPSLFSPDEIKHLMKGVTALFVLAEDAEVTMEANPGTVECGSPAGYRDAGVTRLSIGAQSFDDKRLSTLGRIHSSADVVRAVEDAKKGGFANINIDLMHGLPDQTLDMALDDLSAAIRLEPTHISWYQLTLEPNTVFYSRPPANLPDDDLTFEIQDRGQALLAEQGYEQYEVSAYARDGKRCRHNLNYWLFGDYLAVGAGAHGKITTADGIFRYQKPANPLQYMMTQEREFEGTALTALSPTDRMFEFM